MRFFDFRLFKAAGGTMVPMIFPADARRLVVGLSALAALAIVFTRFTPASNAATVAMGFLVVVLLVAATSRLWVAVTTSLVAVFVFNFFFLPPVGTLTIADPQNWVALLALLVVSLVASNLSAVARARTHESDMRRDELARLFDLSRDILLITESQAANASLAAFIARRFDLDYAAICVPQGFEWLVFDAGAQRLAPDPRELAAAFRHVQEGSSPAPSASQVRFVPLRFGSKPIGLLAAAGRPIERGTLDAVAGLAAIAIERAQFLDDRKAADVARQSEALKSALLASLGHDLRTPLTAIRVAAANLQASWPDEHERREQSDLILTEVDRLTRLFQNILEMARIDAGAITQEMRWVSPLEIIEAARSSVEPTLRGRAVAVSTDGERLVRVDPRLTAAALAQLLENAARYSPSGSPVGVRAAVDDDGLTIAVRDGGPGIPEADLPHVFERFYRGANVKDRRSGTGMGLAIAKGLLGVERGRIAAENCPDGGVQFTIIVPAEVK
jgi:two-component system, OmpR family, sensor histidine kinase KdpD